jgi:hypothetical protein
MIRPILSGFAGNNSPGFLKKYPIIWDMCLGNFQIERVVKKDKVPEK